MSTVRVRDSPVKTTSPVVPLALMFAKLVFGPS